MNGFWISASVVSLATAMIRSIAGHSGPLLDARTSDMAPDSVGFFHAAWYVVSALCFLTAAVYAYVGVRPENQSARQLAKLLATIFLVSAAVVVVVNSFLGWSVATSIPVILLVLIGVLGSCGVVSARSGASGPPSA